MATDFSVRIPAHIFSLDTKVRPDTSLQADRKTWATSEAYPRSNMLPEDPEKEGILPLSADEVCPFPESTHHSKRTMDTKNSLDHPE
jgi:hypothetical protein